MFLEIVFVHRHSSRQAEIEPNSSRANLFPRFNVEKRSFCPFNSYQKLKIFFKESEVSQNGPTFRREQITSALVDTPGECPSTRAREGVALEGGFGASFGADGSEGAFRGGGFVASFGADGSEGAAFRGAFGASFEVDPFAD